MDYTKVWMGNFSCSLKSGDISYSLGLTSHGSGGRLSVERQYVTALGFNPRSISPLQQCRGAKFVFKPLVVCQGRLIPIERSTKRRSATSYLRDTDLGLKTQGYRKKCLQHNIHLAFRHGLHAIAPSTAERTKFVAAWLRKACPFNHKHQIFISPAY